MWVSGWFLLALRKAPRLWWNKLEVRPQDQIIHGHNDIHISPIPHCCPTHTHVILYFCIQRPSHLCLRFHSIQPSHPQTLRVSFHRNPFPANETFQEVSFVLGRCSVQLLLVAHQLLLVAGSNKSRETISSAAHPPSLK